MRAKDFLSEVNMSPSALKQFANSSEFAKMVAGFEAELIFPGVFVDEDDSPELDWDQDRTLPRNLDYDDIGTFFELGRRDGTLQRINDEYQAWLTDKKYDEYHNEHFEEYMDDAREANPDADDSDLEDDVNDEIARVFYSNDAPSLYEWCNENNWNTYADLMNAFNFDWPFYTSVGNTSDAEELAISLENEFPNIHTKVLSGYHDEQKDNKSWYFEPDGSIEPSNGNPSNENEMGVEIVSPPMPLMQMMQMMPAFFEWVKDAKGRANRSTGLHVGISIPGMNDSTIDYIKLAVLLGDQYVLSQFQRQANTYCKSAVEKIKARAANYDPDQAAFRLGQLRYGKIDKDLLNNMFQVDKYCSIHPRGSYIEFRSMGNNYVQEWGRIQLTILRFARAMAIAADPEAYKQEYMKKLAVIMNPTKDDQLNTFISYANGQINRADMIAKLQMKKQGRQRQQAFNKWLGDGQSPREWNVYNDAEEYIVITARSGAKARDVAQRAYPQFYPRGVEGVILSQSDESTTGARRGAYTDPDLLNSDVEGPDSI